MFGIPLGFQGDGLSVRLQKTCGAGFTVENNRMELFEAGFIVICLRLDHPDSHPPRACREWCTPTSCEHAKQQRDSGGERAVSPRGWSLAFYQAAQESEAKLVAGAEEGAAGRAHGSAREAKAGEAKSLGAPWAHRVAMVVASAEALSGDVDVFLACAGPTSGFGLGFHGRDEMEELPTGQEDFRWEGSNAAT